jgi:hypothetical protein
LFLNQRGERLSVRGAHAIITGIAAAGLDDDTTVHIYADPTVMPTSREKSVQTEMIVGVEVGIIRAA